MAGGKPLAEDRLEHQYINKRGDHDRDKRADDELQSPRAQAEETLAAGMEQVAAFGAANLRIEHAAPEYRQRRIPASRLGREFFAALRTFLHLRLTSPFR